MYRRLKHRSKVRLSWRSIECEWLLDEIERRDFERTKEIVMVSVWKLFELLYLMPNMVQGSLEIVYVLRQRLEALHNSKPAVEVGGNQVWKCFAILIFLKSLNVNEENTGQDSELGASGWSFKASVQDLDGQIIVHYGKFNGRAGASWIIPGLRRRIVVCAQRGNSKSGVADAGFQVHMPKKKALPWRGLQT